MRLRTLLGDHPRTSALKDGSIKSDLIAFDFVDYSPVNKGFKPMVRRLRRTLRRPERTPGKYLSRLLSF